MAQNLVHLDEFSMCVLLLLGGMFCKCQSGKFNDDVFQVLCVVTDFLLVGGGGCDENVLELDIGSNCTLWMC